MPNPTRFAAAGFGLGFLVWALGCKALSKTTETQTTRMKANKTTTTQQILAAAGAAFQKL